MRILFNLCLACVVVFNAGYASAQTNTAAIVANTLKAVPSCLDYRVAGVCIWLRCEAVPPHCKVITNTRISHFSPEVVVSTWHDAMTHPWSDYGRIVAATLSGAASGVVGASIDSAGTDFSSDRTNRNILFRDADAIGNPVSLTKSSASGRVICPSTATAFTPHFHSFVDALVWRGVVPAELLYPQSLIPGLSEIGNFPLNTWGSLYPRVGAVTQQIPIKGAAVLAQRVANIISQRGQPHFYTALSGAVGYRYFNPGPVMPNDAKNSKWQRLYPNAAMTCEVFGSNDSISLGSWGDGNSTAEEGYSWNLWRRLECCKVEGKYIGSVLF